MILHYFNENKNLNNWGKVYVNGDEAELAYSRVSAIPANIWWPGKQRPVKDTEEAPFVSLESDKEIEIKVVSDKIKENSEIVVRPQSKGVKITHIDNQAMFSLKEHGAYTFEIDGFHEALHIFYNPERDFVKEEEKSGREIIIYKAGVHEVGDIEISSHTSVIVDAGAVVYGSFTAIGAEDVRICGYGIIDGSKEVRYDDTLILPISAKKVDGSGVVIEYSDNDLTKDDALRKNIKDFKVLSGCIRFYNCKNFSTEGVIMRDSATFCIVPAACDNFVIDNTKMIGMWRYNSDGIDLFNCRNAVIKNCFLRNFDDCIVIKGIVGFDVKNNENISVENCVVWCDWGSALEIGAETNADEYNNIIFKNCDIIHAAHVIMRIHHHNRAIISNVIYDGINAEFTKYQLPPHVISQEDEYFGKKNEFQPALFIATIVAGGGGYGRDKTSGAINGVIVRNTKVYKDEEVVIPHSRMNGLDEKHKVSNVSIENIYINGEICKDYEKYYDNMSFTENIKYEIL